MSHSESWKQFCPVPVSAHADRISLAHGEGARLSRQLIQQKILPRFSAIGSNAISDAAIIQTQGHRLAVCTDSHTVSPLFFPGGDIGSLSVYGTVNDLAVSGADPRWLTLALIIEEGLPIVVLDKILDSIQATANECAVRIISGDTKVVPRGVVDSLMINTTGIGEVVEPTPTGPQSIRIGDRIVVSGPIGCHGIAVLSVREGTMLDAAPLSDSRSLVAAVAALRNAAGAHVRCIRDATRGGISAVLREWATECPFSFGLIESAIPVTDSVRGACELLGLDPLYVANEGTLVAVVDAEYVDSGLAALRQIAGAESAAVIGEIQPSAICPVTIQRLFGSPKPLDEPAGAPLPRIC
jgi:hydrogenase expression/formation protein HypE